MQRRHGGQVNSVLAASTQLENVIENDKCGQEATDTGANDKTSSETNPCP